jgi:hypothetical protein
VANVLAALDVEVVDGAFVDVAAELVVDGGEVDGATVDVAAEIAVDSAEMEGSNVVVFVLACRVEVKMANDEVETSAVDVASDLEVVCARDVVIHCSSK